MLASMTGFGRATLEASFGKIVVEIQTVNRKYLEISISLPKEYSRFEWDIRRWVSGVISRGQVMVRIQVIPNLANMQTLFSSLDQIKHLKQGLEHVASSLGYESSVVSFSFLMENLSSQGITEIVKDEDVDPFRECVEQALSALLNMKRIEGQALKEDIEQRISFMEKHLISIEQLVPEATLRMKKKLQERIAEVAPQLADEQERLLREIAILAEKVDIAEELTRFRSHIMQFRDVLKATTPMGRKMEFLVQELGREINTIGSKSLEAKIAHLVVDVKLELEKIKEQIQNIE